MGRYRWRAACLIRALWESLGTSTPGSSSLACSIVYANIPYLAKAVCDDIEMLLMHHSTILIYAPSIVKKEV